MPSSLAKDRGVLIFAHNDAHINYGKLAACCMAHVKRHLAVPITIVTDWTTFEDMKQQQLLGDVDRVLFEDSDTGRTRRPDAYALSPYQETLLLDVDYLVNNSSLSHVWGSSESLLVNSTMRYLDGREADPRDRYLAHNTTRLYWMTVMYWQKSPYTKLVFDMMKFVQKNWDYFAFIYAFDARRYRNDFALSIALHTLEGFRDHVATLPAPALVFATPRDKLLSISHGLAWHHTYNTGSVVVNTGDLDVHVMNKAMLEKWSIDLVEKLS